MQLAPRFIEQVDTALTRAAAVPFRTLYIYCVNRVYLVGLRYDGVLREMDM